MTKEDLRTYYNGIAYQKDKWKKKNWYYYQDLERFHTFVIPPNHTVLEIGCGTGDLLNAVKPSKGVGIDLCEEMVKIAQDKYPHLEFYVGDAENLNINEKFDYVILSNLIGSLSDIWRAFREWKKVARPDSRVIITYYNYLWEPLLKLGEKLKLKMKEGLQNWLPLGDIENLLYLNDFEVVKKGYRLLLPRYVPLLSGLFNKYIANLPLIKRLCLIEYVLARQVSSLQRSRDYSCSVIIPCRNEAGNIEDAVKRTPPMGKHTELIFVDGYSTDGTVEKIEELMKRYKGKKDIKLIHQIPRENPKDKHLDTPPNKMLRLGKGDAVRKGFDAASGEILMILDADLSVTPEDLPKFYMAMAEGKGEFINGSRMVYQMETQAMRTLNILGNKMFSLIFTWLLEQPIPIRDTLCGTKVLFKKDYLKIKEGRKFFGDFDPYGDFDLLLGAAKLNLKIVEMPIRYRERVYGDIKISRFKHGWLLLKMSLFAAKKMKFRG